jgi:SPP1 family predicted phage head-tail adaptor
MINVGEFRHRVTIRQRTVARNPSTGAHTETWGDLATMWARVRSISGDQIDKDQDATITERYEILIRARTDIHAHHRVVWKSIEMEIDSVIPSGMHESITKIMARRVQ